MGTGVGFRSIRESRGLTIEAIAASTRIPARMIVALEHDDVNSLPARPYARGFVAAYARELGLDPTESVTRFFEQFEAPPPAPDAQPSPPSMTTVPRTFAWRIGTIILAFAVLVPLLGRLRAPGALSERGTVGTSGSVPAAIETPGRAASTPAATATSGSAQPAGGLTVVLTFDRLCWIEAFADGTRMLYGTMQPGATHTLRARDTVTLRVGNSGGVKWSVNGRPAAAMGRSGEVRSVTLRVNDPGIR